MATILQTFYKFISLFENCILSPININNISSNNDLILQAIIWTYDVHVYWCIYASLSVDDLTCIFYL